MLSTPFTRLAGVRHPIALAPMGGSAGGALAWRGREDELAASPAALRDYQQDVASGAVTPLPVWAGEGVDLITDLPSAADLVPALAAQASTALSRAGRS
ncbi:hypothetical protein [Dactylosporangium sp. NPDC005555]|uniref:hypothetical protein n=1 Tax=Dactylosporangium sp. NPDC005555 TaxID=3154889 RepID=UPI0033B345CE